MSAATIFDGIAEHLGGIADEGGRRTHDALRWTHDEHFAPRVSAARELGYAAGVYPFAGLENGVRCGECCGRPVAVLGYQQAWRSFWNGLRTQGQTASINISSREVVLRNGTRLVHVASPEHAHGPPFAFVVLLPGAEYECAHNVAAYAAHHGAVHIAPSTSWRAGDPCACDDPRACSFCGAGVILPGAGPRVLRDNAITVADEHGTGVTYLRADSENSRVWMTGGAAGADFPIGRALSTLDWPNIQARRERSTFDAIAELDLFTSVDGTTARDLTRARVARNILRLRERVGRCPLARRGDTSTVASIPTLQAMLATPVDRWGDQSGTAVALRAYERARRECDEAHERCVNRDLHDLDVYPRRVFGSQTIALANGSTIEYNGEPYGAALVGDANVDRRARSEPGVVHVSPHSSRDDVVAALAEIGVVPEIEVAGSGGELAIDCPLCTARTAAIERGDSEPYDVGASCDTCGGSGRVRFVFPEPATTNEG